MTEETKAVATTTVAAGGIQLRTLDELGRFAKYVAATPDLRPKSINTPEKVLLVIQAGAEVGLAPMASLRAFAPINGKPTIYGDAGTALVQHSGKLEWCEEWYELEGKRVEEHALPSWDNKGAIPLSLAAVCSLKRVGQEKPYTRRFSVGDARLAGLWAKTGPWTQYPLRMLMWRARNFAYRDGFADALGGLDFFEAARDYGPDGGVQEPREVTDLAPARGGEAESAPQIAQESGSEAPPSTESGDASPSQIAGEGAEGAPLSFVDCPVCGGMTAVRVDAQGAATPSDPDADGALQCEACGGTGDIPAPAPPGSETLFPDEDPNGKGAQHD